MSVEASAGDVLVVDDERENVRFLGTLLCRNAYQVHVAESGEQALAIVEEIARELRLAPDPAGHTHVGRARRDRDLPPAQGAPGAAQHPRDLPDRKGRPGDHGAGLRGRRCGLCAKALQHRRPSRPRARPLQARELSNDLESALAERTLALREANSSLRRLAMEISLVEERERKRLAGELHDSPMQKLALAQAQFVCAARRILEVSASTRIVALSMHGDAHYQERMFEARASAYVLKNEAIDDLVSAIHAALRGERFVRPAVGQLVTAAPARSAELDKRALSEREIEVLRLLAEGQRTKDIAGTLGISAKTVETYRGRVMLKLGIDNLPGLVKFAIRAGLVSPAG